MSEATQKILKEANEAFFNADDNFNMLITGVSVFPVKGSEGRLRGIARVSINECLQLTNLRIYDGSNGLFVSYPVEFTQNGQEFRQIFYPLKKSFREYVENVILAHYEAGV